MSNRIPCRSRSIYAWRRSETRPLRAPASSSPDSPPPKDRHPCDPTRFPLVQQNEIGLEALGDENSSALARPEALVRPHQRRVRRRLL